MKRFSSAALLLLLGCASFAQTADWYAARFGFNAPAPDLFDYQSPSSYTNYSYNDGKPNVRWNNTTGIMSGTALLKSLDGMTWDDPNNHQWADLYEMTDLLPKGTWVRVTSNLWNHYSKPYNPNGPANRERNVDAIMKRIMFRGTSLSNGLNILWNVTPGVYPNTSATDAWSTITTDPFGQALATPIQTGDPARRDWWRPMDEYLPYLHQHVQSFVYDVNNTAVAIAKTRVAGSLSENVISRLGFQMGNEPAAGHPGGSIDGAVGSWTGVGKILEQTMADIDFHPSPDVMAANKILSRFGSNQVTMPAFSMLSENVDSYRINTVKGQLRNIQWGGNYAPFLNELGTYGAEMNGMAWQTKCKTRAMHFNSPVYRWKFNATSAYMSNKPNDLLASSLIDPALGRWETPQEYAKRWVDDLEREVNIIANQPMPGSAKIVDVTECYFGGGQSGAISFDSSMKKPDGTTVNFGSMTFDQVRALARSTKNVGGTLQTLPQQPASRESLLAAIRAELYSRDMAGTLTQNLGRIYWWGGYYSDPRNETGLGADATNMVNSYNPWGDYRLTLSEIKALWNVG
ncbi:MAG: hypothetical protein JST12_15475 [Armatimonadetes bacterium]|nr:hypothetical protein [Armatimonadota bacterium]MBS1703065.1 hypothetical protein [Armatimonadota bacterium]MBS1727632.1 hypothetical protein [Armatimonadota bacterium]